MIRSFRVLCLAGLCLGCQAPPEAESDRVYAEALSLLHQGQFSESEALFRRVVSLAPDSAIAQIRLGEAMIRQGRWQSAGRLLDELPTPARQRPEARLLEARLLAFGGFAREAELAVNEILDQYPISLDGRLLLAELYLQAAATMNLERATALCSEALSAQPQRRDAHYLLLQATMRLGRFPAALERSRSLLDAYSDDGHAYLLAGTAAFWAGDDHARPWLEKAVDLLESLDRLEALWLLKLTHERQGEDAPALLPRYRFPLRASVPAATDLRFVDVAARAGVAKKDRGRGSAWLDFDGDGDFDLFSVGIQVEHALYRNDGGQFRDVAQSVGLADARGGWAAASADFDNDGDDDLFVSRDAWEGRAPNSLYRNDSGAFIDMGHAAGLADSSDSFTATWLDFDRDGYLDLYVANGVTGTGAPNALLHNQQNGAFLNVATTAAVADSGQTIGTAAGDFDGDGLTDLYAVNIGQLNRLYRNLGDGTFADVAEHAGVLFPVEGGYVAFFFDLDNDGHLDLFASL